MVSVKVPGTRGPEPPPNDFKDISRLDKEPAILKPSLAYTNTAGKSGLRSNKLNNASSTPSGVSLQMMPSCKLAIRCQCSPAGVLRLLTLTDKLRFVLSGENRKFGVLGSQPRTTVTVGIGHFSKKFFSPSSRASAWRFSYAMSLSSADVGYFFGSIGRMLPTCKASACMAFCSCKAFHTCPWRNTSRLMPTLSTSRVSRRGEVFGA
ncbi:hypothetical protein PA57_05858 [Pseudomonas aeruginosa]|nr:hypothetical protein PA57_05858 [Pseudomonas aeruginosa]